MKSGTPRAPMAAQTGKPGRGRSGRRAAAAQPAAQEIREAPARKKAQRAVQDGPDVEKLKRRIANLEAALQKARAGIVQRDGRIRELSEECAALGRAHREITNSRSWRFTDRLRRLRDALR